MEAIEMNTFLWGGMFDPIVPVYRRTPKKWQSKFERQLSDIEAQLEKTKGATQERIDKLAREKNEVQSRLNAVSRLLGNASLLISQAAMKDAPWLDLIRRTMLPKRPGRVPFHNSEEVARRGYHAASGRKEPIPRKVTWMKLPESEGDLQRGYKAGIVLKGSAFVPAATYPSGGVERLSHHRVIRTTSSICRTPNSRTISKYPPVRTRLRGLCPGAAMNFK